MRSFANLLIVVALGATAVPALGAEPPSPRARPRTGRAPGRQTRRDDPRRWSRASARFDRLKSPEGRRYNSVIVQRRCQHE